MVVEKSVYHSRRVREYTLVKNTLTRLKMIGIYRCSLLTCLRKFKVGDRVVVNRGKSAYCKGCAESINLI